MILSKVYIIFYLPNLMRSRKHCLRTKEVLGCSDGYEAIHKYIDRNIDRKAINILIDLEDDDPLLEEYMDKVYKHRGVEHFKDKYSPDIVRKVAELHIRDDYKGYLPSKEDFSDPKFIKEHHRH